MLTLLRRCGSSMQISHDDSHDDATLADSRCSAPRAFEAVLARLQRVQLTLERIRGFAPPLQVLNLHTKTLEAAETTSSCLPRETIYDFS